MTSNSPTRLREDPKFWVTTASGGTDAFIAIIKVVASTLGSAAATPASEVEGQESPLVANPSRGVLAMTAPSGPNAAARLLVFDLSGRLVAEIRGPAGSVLVWEGRDRAEVPVPTGIYLWRLEAGRHQQRGKIAVVR